VFNSFMKDLQGIYDVVIIDTPPTRHYADAQSVTFRAGDALVVARKNHTGGRPHPEDDPRARRHGRSRGGYRRQRVLRLAGRHVDGPPGAVARARGAARGGCRGSRSSSASRPFTFPTGVDLARGPVARRCLLHGPIIAAVFAWLVWRSRAALVDASSPPGAGRGRGSLLAGLALYLLGRTQSLMVFEAASHLR
jgi:hypothetical protein